MEINPKLKKIDKRFVIDMVKIRRQNLLRSGMDVAGKHEGLLGWKFIAVSLFITTDERSNER